MERSGNLPRRELRPSPRPSLRLLRPRSLTPQHVIHHRVPNGVDRVVVTIRNLVHPGTVLVAQVLFQTEPLISQRSPHRVDAYLPQPRQPLSPAAPRCRGRRKAVGTLEAPLVRPVGAFGIASSRIPAQPAELPVRVLYCGFLFRAFARFSGTGRAGGAQLVSPTGLASLRSSLLNSSIMAGASKTRFRRPEPVNRMQPAS